MRQRLSVCRLLFLEVVRVERGAREAREARAPMERAMDQMLGLLAMIQLFRT
jgi:hypothetical protein